MPEETNTNAVTETPDFKDDDGNIRHLNRKDFPKGKDGSLSHCDYMVEVWTSKKKKVADKYDPKAKAKARIEKLKLKLAELEAEAEDDDDE